jgi:hypothetical protein
MHMRFDNEHHERTHQLLEKYLNELFDDPFLDEESGHFYVGYGSTVLEVSVEPYGPEETIIPITAYCVQGVELEEELLTTYYTYKGWNYDGIPTRERLHELDLDYVADDLEQRGILKDGQGQKDHQEHQG